MFFVRVRLYCVNIYACVCVYMRECLHEFLLLLLLLVTRYKLVCRFLFAAGAGASCCLLVLLFASPACAASSFAVAACCLNRGRSQLADRCDHLGVLVRFDIICVSIYSARQQRDIGGTRTQLSIRKELTNK